MPEPRLGRPKATYAEKEYITAKRARGDWAFFTYHVVDEQTAPHVDKVSRWLRREGMEVRSLNLDNIYLLAVRKKKQ